VRQADSQEEVATAGLGSEMAVALSVAVVWAEVVMMVVVVLASERWVVGLAAVGRPLHGFQSGRPHQAIRLPRTQCLKPMQQDALQAMLLSPLNFADQWHSNLRRQREWAVSL
jgi:hypothetical protein